MGIYYFSLTWIMNSVHSRHGEQATYLKWIKICIIIIIIIQEPPVQRKVFSSVMLEKLYKVYF